MPGIEARHLLRNFLRECQECAAIFNSNVALILDEDCDLTENQAMQILFTLNDQHREHKA